MILIFTLASMFMLQTLQPLQMALPDGNDAWVVRVTTTGGLTGTGMGDFAISSEGKLLCRPAKGCAEQFKPADFQSLIEMILPGNLPMLTLPVVSLCRDCIVRTLHITRRDSMGVLHTYTTS